MKNSKPKIYTIATAHLDTSWLWLLERTITEHIPDTIKRNFEFIEQYPEYKFNFEGSYRYELIKEYYPEDFEKIRTYIKDGRWNPCGACYENGDVNIPSPEALIRNILYGNSFFEEEFGVKSNDIFLPDCFGFGKALPTVAAHCGLTGFSTGKLFWGCAVDVPFDIGRWKGIDGNGIWAALMPFSYTTSFKRMDKAGRVLEKLEKSSKNNLPEFTFAYHGIGDRGGAPHKSSVKNVVAAQRNNAATTEVLSATTKEFFDMVESLPDELKEKMPIYDGEFLLTAHGAGSYTSRNVTKRWNRRCEQLADAAERFASAAFANGLAQYPHYGIDTAWKKVVAHHFHDDITGTSFEECYKRNHNDYIQAMNTFSEEYTAACSAVAGQLDTSFVKGIPLVVSNPLQSASVRNEAVNVTVNSEVDFFAVFDKDGNEIPSQTKALSATERKITFIASVPSCGLSVYDLRQADSNCDIPTGVCVTEKHIENKNISVELDDNGDICSVFDKKLEKELLRKPIRSAMMNNTHSFDWPAWEIKYNDCKAEPYAYPQNPVITVKDNGPALCSLEIVRYVGKSRFTQVISLDSESEYVLVYNETDWREEASLLKAEFSFTSKNKYANYDIGIGYTQRATNTEKLYEVPAQKWADITDESEEYGVAVFSDSRQGWDKPDNSTLRLTLIHTPMANYRWECSQHVMDMGINRYSFAVMGHSGKPLDVTACADAFCQPMHTFVTDKHYGDLGSEYSFVKLNDDRVRITAVKKSQSTDSIVIRVAECSGEDRNEVEAVFSLPVTDAYEIRGDETKLGKANVKNGRLCFNLKHNEVKSFAVTLDKPQPRFVKEKTISLDYNAVGITSDRNRNQSTLKNGVSIPREIVPENLLFAGVGYSLPTDSGKNCFVCDGSKIMVGDGYSKLHLLLTSLNGDKKISFKSGENSIEVTVPDCFEHLGFWDLMQLGETGYIKPISQALTFTHTHSSTSDLIAKQFYVFHAEIPVGDNCEVEIPNDDDILILAATATGEQTGFIKGDAHFDSLSKRKFDYEFSDYAVRLMTPNRIERFLDKFIDRDFSINVKAGEFYNKYSMGELYYILRNLKNKAAYKKNVLKITEKRKTCADGKKQ